MTKFLQRTAGLLAATAALTANAYALPRQAVVIVAEGLNPQTIDLSTGYVKAASQDAEAQPAFSLLKAQAKTANADANVLSSLKGLLKTAQANGYRTGFVTTEDVTTVAPLFYDVAGEGAAAAQALVNDVPFNFVAGGGRAAFNEDLRKAVATGGGTVITDSEQFESVEQDIKGKVLALQSDCCAVLCD
jgi:alkaline phosphatase